MNKRLDKIAQEIRLDYEQGVRDDENATRAQAYCWRYGGRNGDYADFAQRFPKEAEMLGDIVDAQA